MTLNYKTFILNIRGCMNKIIVNGCLIKSLYFQLNS